MKELAPVTVVAYEVVYGTTVVKANLYVPVMVKPNYLTWLW